MEINLNDIASALGWIVGVGGSVTAICAWVRKMLKKLFDRQLEAIGKRLDKVDTRLDKIDGDNCKNYIVQTLSAAERGEKLTTEERMRLAENYQHYIDAGGNSYIKEWHERLKAEGKI